MVITPSVRTIAGVTAESNTNRNGRDSIRLDSTTSRRKNLGMTEVNKRAPRIHQQSLNDLRITVLSDGTGRIDPRMHLGRAPEAERDAALAQAGIDPDGFELPINVVLLERGGTRVLIDTGSGYRARPQQGILLDSLALADLAPADIDVVLLTHFHGDHVGGAVDEDGELVFANARHYMASMEWQHANSEERLAGLKPGKADHERELLRALQADIELVNPGTQIADRVEILDARGHTPGHLVVLAHAGDEGLLHVTDAVLLPLQWDHLDWIAESDSPAVATTRQELAALAQRDRLLVSGAHFPWPGVMRL